MFCINCGAQVSENASFCTKCGFALKKTPPAPAPVQAPPKQEAPAHTVLITPPAAPPPAPPVTTAPAATAAPPVTPIPAAPASGKKKGAGKYAIIAAAVLAVVAGAVVGGLFLRDHLRYKDMLSDAARAASTGDYARAANLYRSALSERPDDAQAQDALSKTLSDSLETAISEAAGLIAKGDFAEAENTLRGLPIQSGDAIYDTYSGHLDDVRSSPRVAGVDTSSFPVVSVTLDVFGGARSGALSVTDGGVAADAQISNADGKHVITYTAEDSPDGNEPRSASISLGIGEFTFPLSFDYTTPVLLDADVTLVSTDFSDYPSVHAFFRVTDAATLEHIPDIGPNSFKISESVSGGEYVAREVKSAEPMLTAGEVYGLNIALVADKSDSISDYDMSKIKTVMREFVGSLSLSGGDKAELIAFDSVVQLMCTFTSDAALLNNGIDNMSTDGLTAFYDAVYQGVRNSALQGGARCVIAFTDGEDNMSRYSANEVIRFANEKQVPLYIIGVGSSLSYTHDTLRTMASSTNGRYWYIDDLYDLTEIYNSIYSELLEMYVVTYESDAALEPSAARGLEISMRGGGYKADDTAAFSPSKTASGGSGSRYEIFLEDVTWEQANERCLERGGHLVTITSKEEEDEIIALAETNGAKYVWLGGYTSYDNYGNVFAHWITGETFTYENWMFEEPSRQDLDGTPEWYLMLWDVPVTDGWTWNDQRNDVSAFPTYDGKLAYVCEYE